MLVITHFFGFKDALPGRSYYTNKVTRRPTQTADPSASLGMTDRRAGRCDLQLIRTATTNLLPAVVLKQLGKLLLQGVDLGTVADHDVGVVGIVQGVVLVIALGVVEAL